MGVIGQGRRGAGKNREEQKKINSAIKTIKIIDKKVAKKKVCGYERALSYAPVSTSRTGRHVKG